MASKSSGRDKCDLDVGMDYVRSVLFEKPTSIKAGPDSAGIVRALLGAFQMITDFVGKRAFVKNVVLITNTRSTPELDDAFVAGITDIVVKSGINVTLIGTDFDDAQMDPERQKVGATWISFLEGLPNSTILTGKEAIALAEIPAPRVTKSANVFKGGELRIGADLLNTTQTDNSDGTCLCIAVEALGAVKVVRPPSRTTVGLDAKGNLRPVQRTIDYEIHHYTDRKLADADLEEIDKISELVEENQYEIEQVDKDSLVKAYKYGRAVVMLNPALEAARKYHTNLGLDICGVIEERRLPRCYLTGEAMYIVGRQNSTPDMMALSAIVDSLMELDAVAIARYVQRPNAEVQMVALIPVYVNSGVTKKRSRGYMEEKKAVGVQRLHQVIRDIAVNSVRCKGGLKEYCQREDIIPPLNTSLMVSTNVPPQLNDASKGTMSRLTKLLNVSKVEKAPVMRKRSGMDEIALPEDDEDDDLQF
ncbi:ATP-dependent DNA helicase II subunit 2 [Cyberlindnera fabianii]|uniref:DNA helicase n=1 Tax=Cyberlindnera fabianii TaxID=36022 RepID=A0A1V2L5K1_CYBFA|nr:ATP-dependent DNA helicase II subunit 2 [Cyberlindnera fabianii]